MPCLIGCAALMAPRILLFCLWAFTGYCKAAFIGWFWPLMGFLFMPYTTLAYLWAMVANGSISGGWIIIMVIAILLDLGSLLNQSGNDHPI